MNEHYLTPVFSCLNQTVLRLTGLAFDQIVAADLGCSNGLWISLMLENGLKNGFLVDSDPEELSQAYSLLSDRFAADRWQIIQADVRNMPIPSASCDLVISRNSMHMWPDLPACWQEIARITRPGGFVFVGRGFGPDLPEDVRQTVKNAKKVIIYGNETAEHRESPSQPESAICEIITNAGFSSVAVIPDHKSYWLLATRNT